MGDVGLSRLWASQPRMAFALHLALAVLIGGFALSSLLAGNSSVALILAAGFLLQAGTLGFLTYFAARDGWRPNTDVDPPRQVPNPQAAWARVQVRERVLWVFFAGLFLAGLTLGFQRSLIGVGLITLSLGVAIVAMLADR